MTSIHANYFRLEDSMSDSIVAESTDRHRYSFERRNINLFWVAGMMFSFFAGSLWAGLLQRKETWITNYQYQNLEYSWYFYLTVACRPEN